MNPNQDFYQAYGKRACDIAISMAALPFVGAVIGACGALIKLEDNGPIFYNAPRVGKDGREFTMYKLRSMKVNAPDLVMSDGSTYNGDDDPRMTKIGSFMRKTSLDEFPQFINVLKGDMSVIGPRPDLKRETELYQGDERRKLEVKPGITGYAAVSGRNAIPWHERLALDVYYVDHVSFGLDAKIFFRTIATVFAQEGIYVKDEDGQKDGSSDAVASEGERASAAASASAAVGACAAAGASDGARSNTDAAPSIAAANAAAETSSAAHAGTANEKPLRRAFEPAKLASFAKPAGDAIDDLRNRLARNRARKLESGYITITAPQAD